MMAERYDFYVHDNRKITFNLTEPIMREDSGVTDFVFHIPKILNELEVSDWTWWLVFVNAKKEKYSIALNLSEDPESPLEKNIGTYTVDYAMSIKAGAVQFALEAINTGTGGAIDNEWHTLTYETKVKETLQGNQAEYAETESDIISALIQEVRTKMNQVIGGATPAPMRYKAQMTDPNAVYLYIGSEPNEHAGHWYYHNGTTFVSGGVYGAGVVDLVPTQGSTNAVQSGGVYDALHDTDTTLSQSGQAADGKATGALKNDIGLLNYKTGSFSVSSGGHSSAKDRVEISLEQGETYYITVESTIPLMVYQIWEYDESETNVKNGGNRNVSSTYTVTALTTVKSIGIYCGPQSSAYTLNVLIEKEGSIFKQFSKIQSDIDSLSDKIDSLSEGVDINVNYDKSEDGKSFGKRYFSFPFFKGQKLVVSNAQPANNNWTCTLRGDEDVELFRFSVTQGETKTVYVPVDGGVRLQVYLNSYPMLGRIVAESMDDYQNRMIDAIAGVAGESTDIVSLNYTVRESIKYAQKLVYGQTIVPFSLIHFSDPHGGKTNVTRLLQMKKALGSLIDDIICTGDMVTNKYADGYSWWDEIDGSETILTCIGNHDVSNGEVYTEYGITREQAYNTYFAPYISSWNVTHSGFLTYWYKDYADKKIRLIALDYLLSGDEATAQNTWLQNALADAKLNDYTVVIAQHCQMSNFQKINSNFTMIDPKTPHQYPTIYQESVQAYINTGGKFACYIAGHTHWDMLCINPDYPNQICITVTCTAQTGRDNDQIRETGTKSQDAANVITIDTTNQTIKIIRIGADKDNYLRSRNTLTISYANKTIIAEK